MDRSGREIVEALLARQRHLVTPAQAKGAGASSSVLPRLARSGVLEVVMPTVYGTVGVPMTWERRLQAALLRAGPSAVASHRAAARLIGLETYGAAPVEITLPSKRHFDEPGVVAHQSRDLRCIPPVLIDGFPCTPPRRLAVDIGAVLGATAYTTVIRDLRRDHGVTWRQLAAVLELHSKRGRDGCGPLRRQVERYFGVDGIPDSALEQLFLDDLIDACLPMPVCQHPVQGPGGVVYRLDFAYPDDRLDVEIDGPRHRRPEVAAKDRRRDAYLRARGWEVLRFDEQQVAYAPGAALSAVRRALGHRTSC